MPRTGRRKEMLNVLLLVGGRPVSALRGLARRNGRSAQYSSFLTRRQHHFAWFSAGTPKYKPKEAKDEAGNEDEEDATPGSQNELIHALEERARLYLTEKQYPIGALDWETFEQMRKLTHHWTQLRSPISVVLSIELLERLVKEQNLNFSAEFTEQRVAGLLNFSLLNALAKNWSLCYRDTKDDSVISPQALLEKMEEWTEQYPIIAPQSETMHSILLGAVSRVETLDDALYVESLLMRMVDEFRGGNARMAPTLLDYNILLHALAKVKQAERAEEILNRLCDDYNAGVSMLRPCAVSFGTVLHGWKRAEVEEGGKRAEALLGGMMQLGEMEGEEKLAKPDAQCYFSVLAAWCAPRTKHCVEGAERFLQRMQDEYRAGNDTARPTDACYGLVIHCWAQPGWNEEAERVLCWMRNDYSQNGNLQAQPTSYHFNPVIGALSRAGGIVKALSLFESMQHMHVMHDSATYGSLILGLSRSRDKAAGKHAERLLREQQQRHREGNKACKPDPMAYNVAMQCWISVGDAKRAVGLLSEITEEHKRGDVSITDDRLFCTALTALSRSRYPNATTVAESIFQELNKLCQVRVFHFQPSAACYAALMGCWASAERPESGHRCMELVNKMQERYSVGEECMRPTEAHYKTVIDAFARTGKPKQAEEVFYEMLQSSLRGNPDAKPGSDSCKALLSSWLMSESLEGIDKVVDLMDRIAEIDRTGTLDLKLEKDAYYLLFDICVKSKCQDITSGAERILRKMKEIHEGGRGAMGPDSRCYNIVINCWGKAGNAERSEALFWEMYNDFLEIGNQKVKPDAFTISTVLAAWSRSRNESAVRRAEVFFERIEKLIAKGNLQHIKLDSVCYASLLKCLAKARNETATETAEAVFTQIQRRYRAGDTNVRPNEACYDALLRCRLGVGQLGGAESLVFTMHKAFENGESHLEPKLRFCKQMLTAWLNSSHEEAPERAERFLRWMNQNLREKERPDVLVYSSLLRCWVRSQRPDSGVRAEKLLMEMVREFGPRRPLVCECFSDVVCAWARVNNLERAEQLLFCMCGHYLNNRNEIRPDSRAFVAVLAAISRAKPSAVGMRCLRIVQALREVENAKGIQPAVPNKVLECWNRSPLRDKDRLSVFLDQMEALDTSSAAPATVEKTTNTNFKFSLAFKY